MNTQLFHFTLGPVQSFVAQARRTRDLWAGSFLLSWLVAQAMVEVRSQGGVIGFPVVANGDGPTDPLIVAIEGKAPSCEPQIGSLPNRFKAEVPDDFDAKRVETAISNAWRRLADAVWFQFVASAEDGGNRTRAIWDRQVAGFWEMSWVQGEVPGDGSDALWLEARKNWRNRWPAPEGGDHCALMGDLQELSGYNRARDHGKQDAFWKSLRLRIGTGCFELRDNERLCAIALIKRLFPRLNQDALKQAIGWVPGGGKPAVVNWPSTAYMAVIPWLREFVGDTARTEGLHRYADEVGEATGAVQGERSTCIPSLEPLGNLAWLEGNFFLPNALRNAGDTPLNNDESKRPKLCKSLLNLQDDHPTQPYYALLLLDGDRLGKNLSKGDPVKISMGLAKFIQGVAGIISRHDGVTLYAGGDDVLALLAMDRALDAAVALRDSYGQVFSDSDFTASIAIVFSHYHLPLREVLAEAHRQLDKVAKEANGRDSLALSWFKASGKAAQWVATWTDTNNDKPVQDLQSLVQAVHEDAFSSGFFYKLKIRYPMLDQHEKQLSVPPNVKQMLQAEYLKSRERKTTLEQSEQAIHALLRACRLSKRDAQGAFVEAAAGKLQLDGLRLARLLSGKETRK